MSLKYADAPPENCVPSTLLDPTPNDGWPMAASRNAVRYGRCTIAESDGKPRSLSCRYALTVLGAPVRSAGNIAADVADVSALVLSREGTIVSAALPSISSAIGRFVSFVIG